MRSTNLAQIEIASLSNLTRDQLIALWTQILDKPVPRKCSSQLMARIIATQLQARRQSGLSRAAKRKLKQFAAANCAGLGTDKAGKTTSRTNNNVIANCRPPSSKPRPGTRLLREWNGVTHIVEVSDNSYVWNRQTYRSLSAIARAITGARWSGPRFFGLTSTSHKPGPASNRPSASIGGPAEEMQPKVAGGGL